MRLNLKVDKKKILKKLKVWLSQAPGFLIQRAFRVFVIFFIIEALLGLALFYYYSFPGGETDEEIVGFFQEKKNLERVVKKILERRVRTIQTEKEYFDLF